MTNTREEVAVAEAIKEACYVVLDQTFDYPSTFTDYGDGTGSIIKDTTKPKVLVFETVQNLDNEIARVAARAAIAASNSKYVPQLVAALRDIAMYDPTPNWQGAHAQYALSQLPEELKQ